MAVSKNPIVVRILALLTALIGVLNVWSALTPALPRRVGVIRDLLPFDVRVAGRTTTVLIGFLFLVIASAISKRKKTAWTIAIFALFINTIAHLIKGLDIEEAVVSAILAVFLLVYRKYFVAKSDAPSLFQGLKVLILALIFTILYGTLGFYFFARHFRTSFSLISAFIQTLKMFILYPKPGIIPHTRFGAWFSDSIYIIGFSTLAYSLFMLLRPVIYRHSVSEEERKAASELLKKYGRTSLAPVMLLYGKHYFFGKERESFIVYKPVGEIALVLADPIGPLNLIPKLVEDFSHFCLEHGWTLVLHETGPNYLPIYENAGFKSALVGHEAIVDLEFFDTEGEGKRNLRYALNHLTKKGYTSKVFNPPQGPILISRLYLVSNEWLRLMHGTEKRFTTGYFERNYIGNSFIMAVLDPLGQIVAFVNFNEYKKDSIAVDLMRHIRDIPSETMLYLFVQLIYWAKEKGYKFLSLGLASLYGVGEKENSPVVEKAFKVVFGRFNQFYNFKGLYVFKEKFHPKWEPRYIVYPNEVDLSRALLALIRADSSLGLLAEIRMMFKKGKSE